MRPSRSQADPDPVGQHVAEALAPADLLGQGDDGLGVAPRQLEAVGLVPGDQAVFKALDGIGDRGAHGDGVDP